MECVMDSKLLPPTRPEYSTNCDPVPDDPPGEVPLMDSPFVPVVLVGMMIAAAAIAPMFIGR
jgi:hypothetical protein